MKPPIFEYRRPATLKEALDLFEIMAAKPKFLPAAKSCADDES